MKLERSSLSWSIKGLQSNAPLPRCGRSIAPSQAEALTLPAASKKATRKRQISPEGRKRIAEATRQRWAAKKAAAVSETASEKVSVPKRRLSPEGRKRIVEATKRRWAAKRAAEASKTSGSPKTAPVKRGARSKKAAAS